MSVSENYYKTLVDASVLAIEKHGLRYFIDHLMKTHKVLTEDFSFYTFPEDVYIASVLHDILEDTDVTSLELKDKFGVGVHYLVYSVTDKEGKNRRERHEKTYPSIRLNDDSIVVKLADRIQNVMRSPKDSGHYKMYKKEYPYFREVLYYEGFSYEKMWDKLDELMEYNNV